MSSKKKHISLSYEGSGGAGASPGAPQVDYSAVGEVGEAVRASAAGAPPLPPGIVPFSLVGRIPLPGDNVAVAVRRVPAGTEVHGTFFRPASGGASAMGVTPDELVQEERTFTIAHTVLEGHRFAVVPVNAGDHLTSWNMPFGVATRPVAPGEYICNPSIIAALRVRRVDFELPDEGNFEDYNPPVPDVDEATYTPGVQVPMYPAADVLSFEGLPRAGGRGVGTRNYVVVMAMSSRGGSLARSVEAKFKARVRRMRRSVTAAGPVLLDGVVAVAHTEGGADGVAPHNAPLVVGAMLGWATHPNIAAVLIVDSDEPNDPTTGAAPAVSWTAALDLAATTEREGRLAATPHSVLKPSGDFEADLAAAVATVEGWLADDAIVRPRRETRPASDIRVALQCGGSDAFSGISGNPLVGLVAREFVRMGGAAVLAETDELIGAETYITRNTRTLETSKRFMTFVRRFKDRLAHHAKTVEANPSGGNKFRGLYNICLKSLGAAQKKPADVRLDHVLEYAEPIPESNGYCFMNSPGNDLESIAGEVATGCNLIFFTTGNGAITNFPFVPTLKVITTTGRWNLLSHDMDINAGEYQDGTPMATLVERLLSMSLDAASGLKTVGERAGHSQVSIWRDWAQTSTEDMSRERETTPAPTHTAHGVRPVEARRVENAVELPDSLRAPSAERLALLLPTSLCSGQVADLIAKRLNRRLCRERGESTGADEEDEDEISAELEAAASTSCSAAGGCSASEPPAAPRSTGSSSPTPGAGSAAPPRLADHVTRFVALPHTEGCGSEGGEWIYSRIVLGHLAHPCVTHAVLLEHGCEKHHNDSVMEDMVAAGLDPSKFGWASVQLDGGIRAVTSKVESLFEARVGSSEGFVGGSGADAAGDKATASALGGASSPLDGAVIGLIADESLPPEVGAAFALVAFAIIDGGGYVVIPAGNKLLSCAQFLDEVLETREGVDISVPSLGFAERIPVVVSKAKEGAGEAELRRLHVMECPTRHWVETITGLAASGCHATLAYSSRQRQAHPFMPVVHTEFVAAGARAPLRDSDVVMEKRDDEAADVSVESPAAQRWARDLLGALGGAASGERKPRALEVGNTDFQITRGRLGVSV